MESGDQKRQTRGIYPPPRRALARDEKCVEGSGDRKLLDLAGRRGGFRVLRMRKGVRLRRADTVGKPRRRALERVYEGRDGHDDGRKDGRAAAARRGVLSRINVGGGNRFSA